MARPARRQRAGGAGSRRAESAEEGASPDDRTEGSAERTRRDPPTLPELPNQWAQLPPTVPSVPTPPHGIRRSTILLIILWLAILALYLWVRPLG